MHIANKHMKSILISLKIRELNNIPFPHYETGKNLNFKFWH